jgi:hypothetical protein
MRYRLVLLSSSGFIFEAKQIDCSVTRRQQDQCLSKGEAGAERENSALRCDLFIKKPWPVWPRRITLSLLADRIFFAYGNALRMRCS